MFPFIFLPYSFYHSPFTIFILPCSFYHVPFTIFILPCSFYHVPFILLPCSLCHVPFSPTFPTQRNNHHTHHFHSGMLLFPLKSPSKGSCFTLYHIPFAMFPFRTFTMFPLPQTNHQKGTTSTLGLFPFRTIFAKKGATLLRMS